MKLDALDLNLLLAFEALVETRSVTRAAERLGLRQPAMSAALARLRVILADPLFVWSGGAMRPTPRAERLTPGVLKALSTLREALADPEAFDPALARQSVTLAMTDYMAFVVLPPLVAELAKAAPGLDLRVVGYDKDDIPALIDEGRIDLALGVFPAAPGRLMRQAVASERFVGLARRGHPVVKRGAVSVEAFAACDHLLVSVRRDARGEIDLALARLGLSRRVSVVTPHMLVVPHVLAASDLIATLPERVARMAAADGLQMFDLPFSMPAWRIEMVWSATARADPAAAWLRSRIVETVSG